MFSKTYWIGTSTLLFNIYNISNDGFIHSLNEHLIVLRTAITEWEERNWIEAVMPQLKESKFKWLFFIWIMELNKKKTGIMTILYHRIKSFTDFIHCDSLLNLVLWGTCLLSVDNKHHTPVFWIDYVHPSNCLTGIILFIETPNIKSGYSTKAFNSIDILEDDFAMWSAGQVISESGQWYSKMKDSDRWARIFTTDQV